MCLFPDTATQGEKRQTGHEAEGDHAMRNHVFFLGGAGMRSGIAK